MTGPLLTTVTRTTGANAALKDGRVAPDGVALDFVDVPVLVQGFRRMVRELEFDVCEMALTTYLVAKEHGVRFTALPVFLVRDFHHGAVQVLAGSGVTRPRDLDGQRVGVNRGYTVTTGVWARAVLAEEHGVDLSSVTWVLSGDEHVAQYRPPANVAPAPEGQSLEALLRSGELAAVVGAGLDAPDVVPLVRDPLEAGLSALRARGHYPVNHLIVVRDELLEQQPELAVPLFDAFTRAKQLYVDELAAGQGGSAADETYRRVSEVTGADPLPYGLPPNRPVLEELLRAAADQGILRRPVVLEDVFAAGTQELTG